MCLLQLLVSYPVQAKGGHNEAAKYLIEKGADVTAVDENGDTALTVAKTPSMVRLLKGKWVMGYLHVNVSLKILLRMYVCVYSRTPL